jgi:hypothetical protein
VNPTPEATRQKVIHLVEQGVSVAAAARAAGVSPRTAGRIVGKADDGGAQPFTGEPQSPANVPPPNWASDQPRPPPSTFTFDPRYHGHTFQSFSAPMSFDGWTLKRARDAISLHRQGIFLESSSLALVLLSFAPVLAATGQRLAPALALPRQIKSGTRGLSRILGAEIEKQLAPSDGLTPSPYFPPTLWGATGFDLAFEGFSIWQHAYGEPDPVTGVRDCYTRRWPTWATQYYRYRRQFVAVTNDGPVDIIDGDGKWSIIADHEEPHFMGAIVALTEEVLGGIFDKRAWSSYIDKYGNPKWIGEMPPGTGVRTPEGEAAFEAISTIRGPDGFGLTPNGMKLDIKGLTAGASTVIKDALESHWQYIAAVLLGSDGTMTRGTGVYSAPIFAGVRRDLVDRDLRAMVRGANSGRVAPWLAFNYAETIAAASGWTPPVLDIPLPDPDADARIKSYSDRVKSFHDIIAKEKNLGFQITQDRVAQLAKSLEIDPPTLVVGGLGLSSVDKSRVVTVDEARKDQNLPEVGGDRGGMLLAELAPAKAEPTGEPKPADGQTPEGAQPGSGESSSDATQNGGTTTGGESEQGSAGKDAAAP